MLATARTRAHLPGAALEPGKFIGGCPTTSNAGRFFKTHDAKHQAGRIKENMFMIITARHPPHMTRYRMTARHTVKLITEVSSMSCSIFASGVIWSMAAPQ